MPFYNILVSLILRYAQILPLSLNLCWRSEILTNLKIGESV